MLTMRAVLDEHKDGTPVDDKWQYMYVQLLDAEEVNVFEYGRIKNVLTHGHVPNNLVSDMWYLQQLWLHALKKFMQSSKEFKKWLAAGGEHTGKPKPIPNKAKVVALYQAEISSTVQKGKKGGKVLAKKGTVSALSLCVCVSV